MATNHNKAVWDELGERDPYYAVVTHDEFRRSNIDADAKAEFFRMGREHLDEIWPEMERRREAVRSVQIRPSITDAAWAAFSFRWPKGAAT
jgi:hypothetical protein